MSRLPWILGVGGGAAALYAWSRTGAKGSTSASASTSSSTPPRVVESLDGRWVWPVPSWQGRAPVISDGFDSPRPGGLRHGAVDLMFARLASDAAMKPGTPNGSKGFVMPDGVPAVAASDGVIWSAMKTRRGFAVVIDHGKRGGVPVATFYTHLDTLDVQPTARGESKQQVAAGQRIGTIGFDPLDAARLKHLHHEVWLGGPADRIDPAPMMRHWAFLPAAVAPPTAPIVVARNASLVYRPVGERGQAYPQWVRDLKDRSGVYLIRDAASRDLLYVGSSSGRLYYTLTRHFSVWRRYKGFWAGQYAEGHDPGLTYNRGQVEVAIRITGSDDSLDEEARLIQRLRPRDNLLGQPADDEVPF